MDAKRFPRRAEVTRSPERVGADEHGFFRPPKGCLAPAEPVDDAKHFEWRPGHTLEGHAEERHAEARGQRGAVPLVPVEELDDADRLAEREHPSVHALSLHGIDEPDAYVGKQRV